MRVIWKDKNRSGEDPCPAINKLEHYINRSKIEGIDQAYTDAINEYIQEYNLKCSEISKLNNEIANLKSQLNVWKNNQHGRRSVLNDINKRMIDNEKLKGSSNRQIAKKLKISEGTVRNYLKNK